MKPNKIPFKTIFQKGKAVKSLMKELIYSIYALLFNLSAKLFKTKKNRVALVSMHNENFNDGLGSIYNKLKESGEYEFIFISRQDLEIKLKNIFSVLSFFIIKSRKFATAKYVFLNDNFLPMSKLNMKKEAVVVQLWHGEGVFKKFGFSIDQDEKVRQRETEANKRLTYVVCSSKAVVPYYAKAFAVSEKNVLPLGSARTDYLFEKGNAEKARKRIDEIYPQLNGKKLVLYAPTFRDDLQKNGDILSHFDFDLFKESLSDKYALLVKLHPQVHEKSEMPSWVIDVTGFDDVRQLALACDVLVTDYSSICMEFSVLDKKTVFFAYDLKEYTAKRDFYFDYEQYVPGRVVKTTAQIIGEIKAPFDKERNERFKRFNFDFTDAESAKRVIEKVIE